MSKYDSLWVEKYRPKKLEELVLSKDNRDFFSKLDNNTPHLLFYGRAGTGKTSLAKIISNDVLGCQYLYINASDENGVDTIRNKVITFAQTKSFDGKKKTIILDEFCGTTSEAQKILRNVMEEYSDNVRFILTSNSLDKIIEPIQSRCCLFSLQPDIQDVVRRCVFILKNENIKTTEDEKIKLVKFIETAYPDLRRIINDLQKFSISGSLFIKDDQYIKTFSSEVYNLITNKSNTLEIRRKIIEEEKKFDSNYQKLLSELFERFYESNLTDMKKKNILIEIGEHLYRDSTVLDKEINFFCCIINLEKALS